MGMRSFLAFELPSDIREVISRVCEDMRKSALDVRWVKPHNVHLTVVFMGSIPPETIDPLGEAVAQVCRGHSPIKVSLKGTGVFASLRNPRVVWVGLDGELQRMAQLRDDLQGRLKPFGIHQESREFRPHLTLGRFRKAGKAAVQLADLLSKYGSLTSRFWSADQLVFFKSELKPGGPVHTRLNGWPLAVVR